MNAEQLHEALNHLDDDLIEAVDALRSQKTKKLPLFRIAGLAACVCLLVGGVLWGFGSSDNINQESAYAPAETVADIQTNYGMQESTQLYSVRLSALEQTAGGLTGTVEASGLFPAGTQVTVVPASQPETAPDGPLYAFRFPLAPSGTEESSVETQTDELTVLFTLWEETESGIVIYAESIEGGQS